MGSVAGKLSVMTKVMALGDTHGDRGFTRDAIRWAAANDVDLIVQVGDFGFWPRLNNGQKFLNDVGKLSVELHVPFYFIDGNHEDHDMLDTLQAEDGFCSYGKYPITFIKRGTRWEWGGKTFGAFGGAYSIDRIQRIKFSYAYGWFPQEVPDESVIPDLGKVDVLFTHDAPIVPPGMCGTGNFKSDPQSQASQRAVYEAMSAAKPSLLIHGHWHHNELYKVHGVTVQALDMNQNGLYNAAVVYDTENSRMYTLKQWEYRDGQQTAFN